MRIVVTGALGHIGSRLIRTLPRAFPGAELLLVDDLSTQRYCSLYDLPSIGRYRFIEADVATDDLAPILSGADVLVHLAAITSPMSTHDRPGRTEEVNVYGTERVARACVASGAALVFISTTSVYSGSPALVDEQCALMPQSPYAASKRRAEQCLEELGRTQGLRFITCRFGTIFGTSPGMRFHTAVNRFCFQASAGRPLTVWRTALDQKRPYLDLTDAVEAISFAIRSQLFDRRAYNVLTTNASVRSIVDIISSHVPNLAVSQIDVPIMNDLSYEVSTERLRAEGFVFRGSLTRGIRDTLRLLRGVPERPRVVGADSDDLARRRLQS